MDFCKEMEYAWDCNKVVFIGDVIDNHYSSYHETDADGLGGGDELSLAKSKIALWYEQFPKATVTIGNHDRIIMRKAQTSNIPKAWIKEYKEVLETPGWDFTERVVIDDVQYMHGEGKKAHIRAQKDGQSTVQGHHHAFAYTHPIAQNDRYIWGMQVGCGVDRASYAMAYAKHYDKFHISCGIMIDGEDCYLERMKL
jgi:hypothetical protein